MFDAFWMKSNIAFLTKILACFEVCGNSLVSDKTFSVLQIFKIDIDNFPLGTPADRELSAQVLMVEIRIIGTHC